MLKHVGMITNTGRRCVVVFREIYNERGVVIDPNNCLVVETDSLPDSIHQDIMRIVESRPAQDDSNFYNILSRERLSDGSIALTFLHNSGRLRKYPTSQVMLTPNAQSRIALNELNKIVTMQLQGKSQAQITEALNQMKTPVPSDGTANAGATESSGVLSDEHIARAKLSNANELMAQAERLLVEAYALDPSLKPTDDDAPQQPTE
jgi:hypothetical protein